MHSTAKLLEAAVPWLTLEGRAVVTTLAMLQGRPGSAQQFARNVGLRNRFQLNRLLHREGLPCLEELSAWIRTLILVIGWEESRTALSSAALRSARDPSTDYKMVERLTGCRWTEVRERGSTWVLLQLVDRCKVLQSAFAARRPGSPNRDAAAS